MKWHNDGTIYKNTKENRLPPPLTAPAARAKLTSVIINSQKYDSNRCAIHEKGCMLLASSFRCVSSRLYRFPSCWARMQKLPSSITMTRQRDDRHVLAVLRCWSDTTYNEKKNRRLGCLTTLIRFASSTVLYSWLSSWLFFSPVQTLRLSIALRLIIHRRRE
jgi:hypothetical protein